MFTAVGCTGPGLEPPWEDRGKGSTNGVRGPSAPVVAPPSGLPTGSFGNSNQAPMTPAAPGTTVTPPPAMTPTTQPPTGTPADPMTQPPTSMGGQAGSSATAGAGAPTMGEPSDAGMLDGSQGNDFGVDFVPDCSDETARALTAGGGSCSYPLPDGVDVATGAARIALLSSNDFTTVQRVDGPLACGLLSGGFYFDSLSMPTRITLCPQSCLTAGAASEMKVVLVLGCPAP